MLNYKLIAKILGSLLWLEALLMTVALATSLLYQEAGSNQDDILPFTITICFTTMVGFIARYYGQPKTEVMNRHEAYLLVSLTWIVFTIFGSLPFLISGLIPSITDAFFETMSGFTTTGSTVVENIDEFPVGLKLWRSMTQWIGGLGIAFFTIAILPGIISGGGVRVFSAEATGPLRSKMHPKLSTNAKMIISMYLVLTIACTLSFWWGGMTVFDAVNYAMSILATGGFSTHQDSLSSYNSAFIDYVSVLFMFLAGVNFTMLYVATIKRKTMNLLKDAEFRFYSVTIIIATLIIAVTLMIGTPQYDFFTAIRNSLFQVVSFMTTTGVFNDNAYDWPRISWLILVVLMFIGGCSGSTSGGLKSVRAVMVFKLVSNEFKKMLHPKAVLPLKINGNPVTSSQQLTLLVFIVLYLALCVVTYCVLMLFDHDWINTIDAITISLSSASNAGPALGSPIGNTTTWAGLSDASKWCCSFLMLMGRLEIFSVLILFSPSFWRGN